MSQRASGSDPDSKSDEANTSESRPDNDDRDSKPRASKPGHKGKGKRRPSKRKVALRIPDDNVARPSSVPPPAPAVAPQKIITINPPSGSPETPRDDEPVRVPRASAPPPPGTPRIPAAALDSRKTYPGFGAELDSDFGLGDSDDEPTIVRAPPDDSTEPEMGASTTSSPPRVSAQTAGVSGSLAPVAPATPPRPSASGGARAPLPAPSAPPTERSANEHAVAADFDAAEPTLPRGIDEIEAREQSSEPSTQPSAAPGASGSLPPPSGDELDIPIDEASIEEEPQRISDGGEALELDAADMLAVDSAPDIPAKPRGKFDSIPAIGLESAPDVAQIADADGSADQPPPAPPAAGQPTSAQAQSARRGKLWWEELFNDDYIRTMRVLSDAQVAKEVGFIEDSLGVAKGATVLDLACGTGAQAVGLSQRGYRVIGLDLSLSMLARASELAQQRSQKINFVQCDMREIAFEDTFDGIYCWNSSFGYFEEQKNIHVIRLVRRALRSGGRLLLDVVNRDFAVANAPSLVWFEGDGCVCMDEMSVDWITSRIRVKRTMMMDDGRTREIEYTVRAYSLHELGKLLHDAGFRVTEVSGHPATRGAFFGADSPRTIILAEKR